MRWMLALALFLAGPAEAAPPAHDHHGEAASDDAFEHAPETVGLVGRVLMMKGHLRVGRELFDRGDVADSAAHFAHPLVELDGDVEPVLKKRHRAPLKPVLEQLANAGPDEVPAAFDAATAALDQTRRAAVEPIRTDTARLFDIVLRIARQAAHEYANGIEEDTVFAPVEYQDGRGMLLAARDFVRGAASLERRNPLAYTELGHALDRMLAAFPGVIPPERLVMTPAELDGVVKRVEALAPRFK